MSDDCHLPNATPHIVIVAFVLVLTQGKLDSSLLRDSSGIPPIVPPPLQRSLHLLLLEVDDIGFYVNK